MSKKSIFLLWLLGLELIVLWACPFLGWIDWHTFWFVQLAISVINLDRNLDKSMKKDKQ